LRCAQSSAQKNADDLGEGTIAPKGCRDARQRDREARERRKGHSTCSGQKKA